ncbi:hypothetical protein [Xenorhabdus sp. Sc-CR9]|uniref:hypothetical protein n=1 Tax=Xenorhabdus sp. Sc-CR9 TaxID=2584468 RepID=UPI001F15AE45|nr:hypothetical protein [Xenorhabdus sp. Sc-CR9]
MGKYKLNIYKLMTPCVFFQLITLLIYLNENIINVGENGSALPILGIYFSLSVCVVTVLLFRYLLFIKLHIILFLLLIAWIALKIMLDLSDLEYLKQMTISTTGGILLFYIMGAFMSPSYQFLMNKDNITSALIIFIISFGLILLTLNNFFLRMRTDIFLLSDIKGAYQRPGNFLSIYYIIISFMFLLFPFKMVKNKKNKLLTIFWLFFYSITTLIYLICSQLMGSNSATGITLGIYVITLVVSLILFNKKIWLKYSINKLNIPWSKRFISYLTRIIIFSIIILTLLLIFVVLFTDFDFNKIRLLGFGSNSNSSLSTRANILFETGVEQLGYSPFIGEMNVAYYITGNSGKYLHNFILNIMSRLGLIGLLIVVFLFIHIFYDLYRQVINKTNASLHNYKNCIFNLYSFFILLYIFTFANMTTSMSWSVIWFAVGFISSPIRFISSPNKIKTNK